MDGINSKGIILLKKEKGKIKKEQRNPTLYKTKKK
jgi:hypothetical protein